MTRGEMLRLILFCVSSKVYIWIIPPNRRTEDILFCLKCLLSSYITSSTFLRQAHRLNGLDNLPGVVAN